jgi:hypothetical protein
MIDIEISDDAVGVSTPFIDYMDMLFQEMGQVTTVLTKAQLKTKMLEAAERLNLDMKTQVKPFAHLVRR